MKLKDLLEETKIERIYLDGIEYGRYDFDALKKADKTGQGIYNAGTDWKKFDHKKGLDALIKVDKTGQWILDAGVDWEKFDYDKAKKALRQISERQYRLALKYWPKGIEQSIEKTKELEKTSKKLPMKKLKLEDVKTKTLKQTYDDGCKGKKYDLDDLIKKDKNGEWIYGAGVYWKQFDYKKGSNALMKVDKTGRWIYYAGIYWDKFGYEKGLEALRQIDPRYYKVALKNWPEGIKQNIKKTKELEKTSKKLPMKKLKLEGIKTKSIEQIYINGHSGKYDLDALIKKDKEGKYIYRAGMNWKKFDYNKGLDALIKVDEKGIFIYNAGIDWKKFNYDKATKALKQKNKKYYKLALEVWPKGIEQSQEKIKKLEKTSKKLPMRKLKI